VYLKLAGAVQPGTWRQIEAALGDAQSASASALALDIDLRGGDVASAQLAVGSIVESSVPVYAYIGSAAWGAGALLALASDSVFMEPTASFGWGDITGDDADISAAGLRELRSEFGVLALRKGLDDQVAMAMVDPEIAIDGLVDAGERLTLSTAEAIELGFAAGQADGLQQMLDALGLEEPEVVTAVSDDIAFGIRITVSNQNWRDVRISVLHGATGSIRQNLGQVTSMSTEEFNLPSDLVVTGSRIQAIAQVVGSSEQTVTEQITVQPGLAIDWIIANMISQSNYFAYIRN
jgi:membrane-bound ClpP family serine protease